jgi:hypothetical protein
MKKFDVTMRKEIVMRVELETDDPDAAWVLASAPDFNDDGAWARAEPRLVEVEDAE